MGHFREKAKAIALLLVQNRCFPNGPIFAKSKGYSLTFWSKISVFQMGLLYFREKAKAIALLFGPKSVLSKRAYFPEKAKAIALLFGQKSVFSKRAYFREKAKGIS